MPTREFAPATLGDEVKAEEWLRKALSLQPDQPQALYHLADLSFQRGELGNARSLITRHLQKTVPAAEALWLAARIEHQMGDRNALASYGVLLNNRYPGVATDPGIQRRTISVTEPSSENAFSPAASAGTILLEERRRQGMSLGDVSRQLKLSVRQIEAIERDDFAWLGGAVFVHGFLRNYAKLLHLEPEPLIRRVDAVLKPLGTAGVSPHARASVSRSGPSEKSGRLILMIGALLVVAGGLVFWGWQPAPAPSSKTESESVPEAAKSVDPAKAEPAAQVSKSDGASGTTPALSATGSARVPAKAETAGVVREPPAPKFRFAWSLTMNPGSKSRIAMAT